MLLSIYLVSLFYLFMRHPKKEEKCFCLFLWIYNNDNNMLCFSCIHERGFFAAGDGTSLFVSSAAGSAAAAAAEASSESILSASDVAGCTA